MSARVRNWLALAAAGIAAGSIPAVLMLLYIPGMGWREFAVVAAHGCAYSFTIGGMAMAVMTWAVPRFARVRGGVRWPALVLLLLVIAIAGTVPATLLLGAAGWVRWDRFWRVYQAGLRWSIGITVTVGLLITVIETLRHRLLAAQRELQLRLEAEKQARGLAVEARLSSLESRIHPHFLFNTLNSIGALIREDPAQAERTLERLAALLRYSLDSHAGRLVTFEQELRIVSDYLEIEKTRFGDRLRFSIDASPEADAAELPPMALQTLVENGIKHGTSRNRHGGEVTVWARCVEGALVLRVSDDGPGFDAGSPKPAPGHGLANLRERIEALYGAAARLDLARRDGRTVAELTLPLGKEPA